MSTKQKPVLITWGKDDRLGSFYCPGCEDEHVVTLKGTGAWGWNGDIFKPTLTPSVLAPGECHSYVTDGQIQFLTDSKHGLAGQTVPLPPFPKKKPGTHYFISRRNPA